MKSFLSPHANGLLDDIIDAIADAFSYMDALRWNDDIQRTILTLEDHPQSGDGVPLECFDTIRPYCVFVTRSVSSLSATSPCFPRFEGG